MRLQKLSNQRQAQSRTSMAPRPALIYPVKPIKNPRQLLSRNAYTFISHLDTDARTLRLPANPYPAALGRILNRIFNEVFQNETHGSRVGFHGQAPIGGGYLYSDVFALGERLQLLQDGPDSGFQRERLYLELPSPTLYLSQEKDILNKCGKPLRLEERLLNETRRHGLVFPRTLRKGIQIP